MLENWYLDKHLSKLSKNYLRAKNKNIMLCHSLYTLKFFKHRQIS